MKMALNFLIVSKKQKQANGESLFLFSWKYTMFSVQSHKIALLFYGKNSPLN